MRFQFIICKVLQREAYFCAAQSPNVIDIVMLPQGLHNEPDELRRRVTSKGGTTEAAFRVLDGAGVKERWVEAIRAAPGRSRELSAS